MKENEKMLERILKALGNRRRLLILQYLKRAGEAPVGDIAEEIKLSFNATSKHLRVLYGADIVEREQRSLQIFYRLSGISSPTVRAVLGSL